MTERTLDELAHAIEANAEARNAEALEECAVDLERLGSSEAQALAVYARAHLEQCRGSLEKSIAYLERARDLFTELDDQHHRSRTLHLLGLSQANRGDAARALASYQQALEAYHTVGDQAKAASITCNIGFVYESLGQYAAALEFLNRALDLHEQHGPPAGVPNALLGLANIAARTGDYPAALEYNYRALERYAQLGHQLYLASVHNNIGNIYSETGSYAQALEHYRTALSVFEAINDRHGAARASGNIGVVHWKQGHFPEAREQFTRTVETYQEFGDQGGVLFVTGNLLTVAIDMGDLDRAAELLAFLDGHTVDESSVVIQRERSRARIQELTGDLSAAQQTLQAALTLAVERSDAPAQVEAHKQLRDLALKRNDLASYVEHNDAFTRIAEEINGKETATRLAMQEAQRVIDLERREHEKHLAVLHATLPKHIADRVARGETVSDHFDRAAVLFTDIAGFTTHSSALPSHEVTALLEQMYKTFDEICRKHGVTKVKTIGDSYLCFAHSETGDRKAESNAEERVAAVALAMQNAEFYWPTATANSNSNRLHFRIGIHSGPVTAGVIGTARLQYDIWGDTVNVASRMESTGEPGRIQVSESFARALCLVPSASNRSNQAPGTRHQALRKRGAVEVKGKGLMTTYWLEGA